MRNPEQVSEALRVKIARELDSLNYIPNRAPDIFVECDQAMRDWRIIAFSLTNQVFAQVIRVLNL